MSLTCHHCQAANPGDAMFWKVKLDADKVPDPADIARAAHENVQIRITLARP